MVELAEQRVKQLLLIVCDWLSSVCDGLMYIHIILDIYSDLSSIIQNK